MKRVIEILESFVFLRVQENIRNDKFRTKSDNPDHQNVFDKAYEINEGWIEEYREAIRVLKKSQETLD